MNILLSTPRSGTNLLFTGISNNCRKLGISINLKYSHKIDFGVKDIEKVIFLYRENKILQAISWIILDINNIYKIEDGKIFSRCDDRNTINMETYVNENITFLVDKIPQYIEMIKKNHLDNIKYILSIGKKRYLLVKFEDMISDYRNILYKVISFLYSPRDFSKDDVDNRFITKDQSTYLTDVIYHKFIEKYNVSG